MTSDNTERDNYIDNENELNNSPYRELLILFIRNVNIVSFGYDFCCFLVSRVYTISD